LLPQESATPGKGMLSRRKEEYKKKSAEEDGVTEAGFQGFIRRDPIRTKTI